MRYEVLEVSQQELYEDKKFRTGELYSYENKIYMYLGEREILSYFNDNNQLLRVEYIYYFLCKKTKTKLFSTNEKCPGIVKL